MGLLERDERRNLIEMLLKLPISHDAQARRSLVRSLPATIRDNIPYSSSPRTDIEAMIDFADADSAQRADGAWPVVLVIEDAIGLVAGSMLASRLQQLLDALRMRTAASPSSGQLGNQAEELPAFYTTSSSPVPTSWSIDLDYVDWCSVVLSKCIEVRAISSNARILGVDGKHVLRLLFGEEMASRPDFWESPPHRAMIGAIEELKSNSLLEDGGARHFWKVTQMGLWAVKNMRSFWDSLYRPLEPEQEQVLRVVNRLSPHTTTEYAELNEIDVTTFISELGMDMDLLAGIAQELKQLRFVAESPFLVSGIRLRATYRGLVQQTRCTSIG
jgi:hypothetical protein